MTLAGDLSVDDPGRPTIRGFRMLHPNPTINSASLPSTLAEKPVGAQWPVSDLYLMMQRLEFWEVPGTRHRPT